MKRLIYVLVLIFLISCDSPKSEFRAVDLRCEYLENPLGLDVPAPRLFWKMEATNQGPRQTAWQIQVASTEEKLNNGGPDFWDSGVVKSDQSIQIEYKGKPLQSGQNVSWMVKYGMEQEQNRAFAWNNYGHPKLPRRQKAVLGPRKGRNNRTPGNGLI